MIWMHKNKVYNLRCVWWVAIPELPSTSSWSLELVFHENFPEIVYFNTEAERGEALTEIFRLLQEKK